MEKFKEFSKKNEKYIVIGFLAVIAIVIIGYAVSVKQKQIKNTTYEISAAKKVTPYQGQGKIQSDSTYTMRVPKDARLTTTLQAEQTVKKGQRIGTLTFPDKQTQLEQVQAKISDLQNQLQSQQDTASRSSDQLEIDPSLSDPTQDEDGQTANSDNDSQQEMQAIQEALAQSQQDAAQQQLDSLQDQLSDQQAKEAELSSQVKSEEIAPFDGTFQLKQFQNGTQEIRVYAHHKILEAKVDQDDYSQIQTGKKISLQNSVVDKTQKSKISFVSELPLKQKGTDKPAYKFAAPVNESFLKGQIVHFKVPQKGLQIPLSSVKNNKVYLVQADKTAHQVQVTGRKLGKRFIVSAGLKKGDKIVVHPNKYLHNGVKVHEK